MIKQLICVGLVWSHAYCYMCLCLHAAICACMLECEFACVIVVSGATKSEEVEEWDRLQRQTLPVLTNGLPIVTVKQVSLLNAAPPSQDTVFTHNAQRPLPDRASPCGSGHL